MPTLLSGESLANGDIGKVAKNENPKSNVMIY
jgi:hypothetical protein